MNTLLLFAFRKSFIMTALCVAISSTVFSQNRDTTSYIQTVDVKTGQIDTVLVVQGDYEAPNWHPGNFLIVNFRGLMYRLDLKTKELKAIYTGKLNRLMDDHGLSPDGKFMAITNTDKVDAKNNVYKFSIYTVPITGGEPKRITPGDLSFWHGWSPDGKTLTFCGGENFDNLDVYTIPAEGGIAKRLTSTPGLDDGPEYSPDGKFIYFHSYRTGHMQLWRMRPDGSYPEQMTYDQNSNWFAHPSPDNKSIAYIAYTTDQKQSHPFGQDVKLRIMDLKNRNIRDITGIFFGGAGTINTPSWSPDSKKIAFVSYAVK